MDSVAKTSLLTAAMRAAETHRSEAEGRLFSDPYAELLAGQEGRELLARAIAAAGEQPAIAIRTKFMDDRIMAAVAGGVRQIVMLAAGMDTRAFRLALPKDLRLFELDRQEVLDYKTEKLSGVPPVCKRTALAVDLREDWTGVLVKAGWKRGEPTLWMVEGLLMYLHEPQVRTVFDRINSLASKGDYMLFDMLNRVLLESPFMKNQLDFLASIGAPWHFGENEPEKFMAGFGWKATALSAADVAPARWPFPVAPRHVPGIPRGFFIEARKE